MKTHPGKLSPIVLVIFATVLLLLGQPTYAGNAVPLHTLDITENSSTSLTVIFDLNNVTASVVALNSPDQWTLTFNPSIQFGTFNIFWFEPDDPTSRNGVFTDTTSFNVLHVFSDQHAITGGEMPDGTPIVELVNVNGQQGTVGITFHDLGDAAVGVPENGSTLVLLFVSLTALLGANRFRYFRWLQGL